MSRILVIRVFWLVVLAAAAFHAAATRPERVIAYLDADTDRVKAAIANPTR